ncbi:hypothetical protein DL96DRAFT_1817325 [Flagelloscypha sp. PMI_526]|nr:hypothetical protein DL96DRAFT_1817325 [Flagelloscypha sp. PMI_526]
MAGDSYTFTVGKLDAGMAILLGERAHLIEFPSILLPAGATTGSIVSIAVHQNHAEEKRRDAEFWDLQKSIVEDFGHSMPSPPVLKLRNVTQTSVTLEWPHIELATAKLRSLDIYRDGQRLAAIPTPATNTSTKLSGLKLETDYAFQLVLRTTAGTYPSNVVRVRTHAITDTSGISVCFGTVQDEVLLENSKMALGEMGAKWSEKIQIDTTHFVCTTPGSGVTPGVEYQRAQQLSIPIIQPYWILACHSQKTMVPVSQYALGTTPPTPSSANLRHQQQPSQPSKPAAPAPAPTSPPATGVTPIVVPPIEPASPSPSSESTDEPPESPPMSATQRKRRSGTMNKEFKFPPGGGPAAPGAPPPLPSETGVPKSETPTPEPPPKPQRSASGDGDDDVGSAEGEEGMTEIEL